MKLKRKHNQNREFIVDATPAELNINFRSKKAKESYKRGKLEEILFYPLKTYKLSKSDQKKAKEQYEQLVEELLQRLEKPNRIKYNRGFIEDFFKIMKFNLGFKNLNKNTLKSIRKHTALTLLLVGLIVHLRIKTKSDFQNFAEGKLI